MAPLKRPSLASIGMLVSVGTIIPLTSNAFTPTAPILSTYQPINSDPLFAKKKSKGGGGGFGGGFGSSSAPTKKKAPRGKSGRGDLISTLNDDDSKKKQKKSTSQTYVKSDQEQLLNDLAAKSADSVIGRAVAKSPEYNSPDMDPFWQLLPSLISTKFPSASDDDLKRVAGMVEFSLGMRGLLEDDVISDPWRPHEELHAYMPGLGKTEPFLDPNSLDLCQHLSENYDVITKEYEALLEERFDRKGKDRFQSVTSMNCEFLHVFAKDGVDLRSILRSMFHDLHNLHSVYICNLSDESGWKTMVLFYNGHRLKDFPYHLCPVTTRIMESVPLAGRIAGFNRQQPGSGIPLHRYQLQLLYTRQSHAFNFHLTKSCLSNPNQI